MADKGHFVLDAIDSNWVHIRMNISGEGLVVHPLVPLREPMVPQVHHVAGEVALDGFRFGEELEWLTLAEETMQEDNVLVSWFILTALYDVNI